MKKVVLFILLLSLPFGVAGAATVNGDFEGNPIVNVLSDGQKVNVDDVPAIIYKDRTVVPIAMLRQLGATVSWDASTYSVNVVLPHSTTTSPANAEQLETERLYAMYQWLKDTDTALLTFAQQLQQYANVGPDPVVKSQLDSDYEEITKIFNESLQLSLKVVDQVKNFNDLRSITKSESDTLNSINQAKNLLSIHLSGNTLPDFEKAFNTNMLYAVRSAQKNVNHTNDLIHKIAANGVLHLPDATIN